MPVLRSREVVFRTPSPKPPTNRKSTSNTSDPPLKTSSPPSRRRSLRLAQAGAVPGEVSASRSGHGRRYSAEEKGKSVVEDSSDFGGDSVGGVKEKEKEKESLVRKRASDGVGGFSLDDSCLRAWKRKAEEESSVVGLAENEVSSSGIVGEEIAAMEFNDDVDEGCDVEWRKKLMESSVALRESEGAAGFSNLEEELIAELNIVQEGNVIGQEQKPGESLECYRRRMSNRSSATRVAKKFAVFETKKCDIEEVDEDEEDEHVEGKLEAEDWPGPFSTAMKILRDRGTNQYCHGPTQTDTLPDEITWTPSVRPRFSPLPAKLTNLCMRTLCENIAEIESLEGLLDVYCEQLVSTLCSSRKMNYHVLGLLASEDRRDISIADCSWVTEEKFSEFLSNCKTEELEVLRLNFCGRCLPDFVVRSSLAWSPNCLPKLTTVSLCGNYRLSDDGLCALVSSAPMLQSVNLSQCSLLTSGGISDLAEKLKLVLRELILDDCSNINALEILPALNCLKKLETLSMCAVESVNNTFVKELTSVLGSTLKVLGFAGCQAITPIAIRSIGENCIWLYTLDLRNVQRLNDRAISHLSNCCGSVEKLMLQSSDCSDEAIAALLVLSGRCLKELSLNNFRKVGPKTAKAISQQCSTNLKKLDLSFCRIMSDKALGLIVDSCSNLKILKLFGCSQVTSLFLNGHSNPNVRIIGLRQSVLSHLEQPEDFYFL